MIIRNKYGFIFDVWNKKEVDSAFTKEEFKEFLKKYNLHIDNTNKKYYDTQQGVESEFYRSEGKINDKWEKQPLRRSQKYYQELLQGTERHKKKTYKTNDEANYNFDQCDSI